MKKIFDKEYSTQFPAEMKYLLSVGIKYEFVKEIDGITIYKYKKTSKLFSALESFYYDYENRRLNNNEKIYIRGSKSKV